MFNFFKYQILFSTFNIEQYNNVINILKDNDIFYKTKIINITHGNRGLGRLGENAKYSNEFEILVKTEDFEEAKYLTNVL